MPSPGAPSSSWPRSRWASAAGPKPPTSCRSTSCCASLASATGWQASWREHGLTLSCVNAAGNPLHPDPAVGAAPRGAAARSCRAGRAAGRRPGGDDERLPGRPRRRPQPGVRPMGPDPRRRAALELAVRAAAGAVLEGAGRVGARGRAVGADLPRAARRARPPTAPAASCGSPRPAGGNVRVNFDPSHFWWQGIDPLRVHRPGRRPDRLQPRQGHAAAPRPDRRHGVIDFRFPVDPDTATWHFAAVGAGRGVDEWSRLLRRAARRRLRRRRLDRARGSRASTPRQGIRDLARGAAGRAGGEVPVA